MIIYCIDIPVISRNLNKTYFKKLEIIEFELDTISKIAISTITHEYKLSEWQRLIKDPHIMIELDFGEILDSPINANKKYSNSLQNKKYLIFSNLDYAKISKIRLIDKMRADFEDKITKLQLKIHKTIPKTDKLLQEMLDELPEEFI